MDKKRQLTSFGAVVRKRLIDMNMKQVELAEKIGTSKCYLNLILHGERSGEKYIEKIMSVLALDPKVLEKIA